MSRKDVPVRAARNECGKLAYPTRAEAKRAERDGVKFGRGTPMKAYLCSRCGNWHLGHNSYLPKPALSPRSVRMRLLYEQRRKLVAKMLDGATCRYPDCGRAATEVHELRSRARGGSILDEANCVTLCHDHHQWITEHPKAATEQGWSLPRVPGT
jgi:hypothetical protein